MLTRSFPVENFPPIYTNEAVKDKDFVYHLTTMDLLEPIASGLVPNPERGSDRWKKKEALLDSRIPAEIAAKGISRLNSVYAHPDVETIEGIYTQSTRSSLRGDKRLVAIEVAVNPNEVVVCDASAFMFIYPPRIDESGNESFSRGSLEAADNYWNKAISLEEYRRYYEVENSYTGMSCTRKDDAPSNLPYVFLEPEVLIPGIITEERMRWASSCVLTLSEHINW